MVYDAGSEAGGTGSSARETTPRAWPVREEIFFPVVGFQMPMVASEEPERRRPGMVELRERDGTKSKHLTKSLWPLGKRRMSCRVSALKQMISLSQEPVYSVRVLEVWETATDVTGAVCPR